ncbi:ArsR/SmtB family transcription factor [Roseisalinus antarcticus]|nr:metalloregulator ArsR/SmtB family transcription factor [Roseisalinus antarcticus]
MNDAVDTFAALGQPLRLSVLRRLVQAGPPGLTAGQIAEDHGTLANTLSSHLRVLSAARLVTATREGRHIRYRADMEGLRTIMSFLLEDCCGGRPALCRPVIAEIADLAC